MTVNPKDMTDKELEDASHEKRVRTEARVREAQDARNRTRQLALDVVLAELHAEYGVSREAAEDIWSELDEFYEDWDR
jgi:hypothetical protein